MFCDFVVRIVITCFVLCFMSCMLSLFLFFFKQKTAYEMRISDWSSDVCSSDLAHAGTNTNILSPGTMVDAISGNAVLNGIPVQVRRVDPHSMKHEEAML